MPSFNRIRDLELMDADRVEDLKDPDSWAEKDNLIYDDPQHKDFALSRYVVARLNVESESLSQSSLISCCSHDFIFIAIPFVAIFFASQSLPSYQ